jgi:alpha-glucosidase
MPAPRNALVLVFGALVGVLTVQTPAANAEALTWSAGSTSVQITAIRSDVFRISIDTAGQPAQPIETVFLDPRLTPADLGRVSKNASGHQELQTTQGILELDPTTGSVSLRDAQGNTLMPPAVIAEPRPRPTTTSPAAVGIHVGWPQDRPFEIYGCGNGADHLLQHEVKAHVDNGIAVEPFFWAPAGFANFVVGSDDNTPAQCDGDVENGAVTWSVPGKSADLYLIIAPTLGDASRSLLSLTGRPPVPPRWAFGYLQSRWGWVDQSYVDDALKQFTTRRLPVDAFIIDFEWYTTFPDYEVKPEGVKNFSDFGWNPALFPHPAEQLKQMHDAGIHFVGIRKPRLGNDQTLAMIRSKGWDLHGGPRFDARDLQFSNPGLRSWYARQDEPLLRDGVDGWWNDEGEFTYTTYTYWNQTERQALDAVHPTARLWTLNRAFQPGTSRWGAAAWTGDVTATWDAFQKTPTALLNWSVAGMPYDGCDIGGYSGETNPELLVRWMQAGTFFPVMRAHSERTVKPHFPWLFGPDAEAAIRKTLDLRYRLVPMLYSLAHTTTETGEPIMRPLVMQYPRDPNVADLSSEWLVGTNLLVAPVLTSGGRRSIYLPDDIWYDFSTGERVAGNRQFDRDVPSDVVPLYVRGGSILTLAPEIQHTQDLPGGPLDLEIFSGRDGQSTLVEDDGSTTAYSTGNLRRTIFKWNDVTRTLSWTQSGPYNGRDCFRSVRITLRDGTSRPPLEQPLGTSGEVVVP